MNNLNFSDPVVLFIAATVIVSLFFMMMALRNWKFLGYIFKNIKRNPIRAVLTLASTFACLFLTMILTSFFAVQQESANSVKPYNRIVVMSSQGFAQKVPISLGKDIESMKDKGVLAITPFSWYGGKLGDEPMPFAQFGVDPETFFTVYSEMIVPEDQIRAWQADRTGCLIGSKLAEERGYKIGDTIPLKGDTFPIDLELTVRAIYNVPKAYSPRDCYFHWSYMDEKLKQVRTEMANNAGVFIVKCKDSNSMPNLVRDIDLSTASSPFPTRTQTEDQFSVMFIEMWGDIRSLVRNVGFAAVLSLICAAGNAMAMALRERTTEVAVLKAIGFGRERVFSFVILESLVVTILGGLLGSIGAKLLFDVYDISRFSGGFLAAFFVNWTTALFGLAISFWIGLASGFFPAARAATLSVVQGLRKVV